MATQCPAFSPAVAFSARAFSSPCVFALVVPWYGWFTGMPLGTVTAYLKSEYHVYTNVDLLYNSQVLHRVPMCHTAIMHTRPRNIGSLHSWLAHAHMHTFNANTLPPQHNHGQTRLITAEPPVRMRARQAVAHAQPSPPPPPPCTHARTPVRQAWQHTPVPLALPYREPGSQWTNTSRVRTRMRWWSTASTCRHTTDTPTARVSLRTFIRVRARVRRTRGHCNAEHEQLRLQACVSRLRPRAGV